MDMILPFRSWPYWKPTRRQKCYWNGYREIELAKKKAQYWLDPTKEAARKKADNIKHRRARSEYRRAYYLTNREEELKRNRAYRKANRDRINAAQRVYRAEVKEIARIKRAAKRERDAAQGKTRRSKTGRIPTQGHKPQDSAHSVA